MGSTTIDNTAEWTLIFVMPLNQPTPTGTATYTPYQPISGNTAPTWPSTFNATVDDGRGVGTPGVRWQRRGLDTEAGVVETYPYLDSMLSSPGDNSTPIWSGLYIDVRGNRCARTISISRPVLYSDLGFGQMFTKYGYLNPVLGQVELQCAVNGINIWSQNNATALLKQVNFTGNRDVGVANSILIGLGVHIAGSEITHNELVDFLDTGIEFAQASGNHRLHIVDNLIDGDPNLQGRVSGTNGTWQSGLTAPIGCRANRTTGVLARGNRDRNLFAVDDGNAGAWQYERNWIYCNPAALGFSTGNVGVGTVPAAGERFLHISEDGTSADVTMGNMLNGPGLSAPSQPTSGTFVQGQFVRNEAPTVSGGR